MKTDSRRPEYQIISLIFHCRYTTYENISHKSYRS